MREIDVELPEGAADGDIAAAAERACAREGLRQVLRGTLASYPGCAHWHYKRNRDRGTLEITWWPARRRLWCKIASGRNADWIDDVLSRLPDEIARQCAVGARSRKKT